MHLHRVTELYLQSGFDYEQEGAIVQQPGVYEEHEAEQIQLSIQGDTRYEFKCQCRTLKNVRCTVLDTYGLDQLLPLKVHGGLE